MKKLFVGLVLGLVLVGVFVGVFVSAGMSTYISPSRPDFGELYKVSIEINDGWNLIPNININPRNIRTTESSEVKISNLLYKYYYSTSQKEYWQIHPEVCEGPRCDNLNDEEKNELEERMRIEQNALVGLSLGDYMWTSAVWVYSDKEGLLEFEMSEAGSKTKDYMNNRKLLSGWNFVVLTPEVIDAFLAKDFGSCNIERGYFWDAFSKKWIEFPFSDPNSFTWDGDNIEGYGLVIKISSDCTLGSSTTSPPGLPGGAQRLPGDSSYLIERDIGDNEYVDYEVLSIYNHPAHVANYNYVSGNVKSGVSVIIFDSNIEMESFWEESYLEEIEEGNPDKSFANGVDLYIMDDGSMYLTVWRFENYIITVNELKTDDDLLDAYLEKYS